MTPNDEYFMAQALDYAQAAFDAGEVPIGAVVVHEGEVIGSGFNQTITTLDPSAHAEMVAIRQAAQTIGNYRLVDCTLYVTLEPCSMCTGLLVHSRISRLVYGAAEPKAGAIASASLIEAQTHFNHQFEVSSGVLGQSCAEIMTRFFQQRRAAQKALKQSSKQTK